MSEFKIELVIESEEHKKKLISKMLYAFEKRLGEHFGYEPIKQGEHFIDAMNKAFDEMLKQNQIAKSIKS